MASKPPKRKAESGEAAQHEQRGNTHPRKRRRLSTAAGSSASRMDKLVSMLKFWLSVANLSKDRYLVQQMAKNDEGWIPAKLFVTFNKAKASQACLPDIVTALSLVDHPHIELEFKDASDPRLRVRGGIEALMELIREHCVGQDMRTIYVETLPSHATRAQVSQVFESFGDISHISIPLYPNGRSKGFAFVEFRASEGAEKALAASKNGMLGSAEFSNLSAISRADWKEKKENYNYRKRSQNAAARKALRDEEHRRMQARNNNDGPDPSQLEEEVSKQPSAYQNGEEGACSATVPPCSYDKNVLVSITGLSRYGDKDDNSKTKITRAVLFKELEEHGPLIYVDYSPKTADQCIARYMHESGAQRAVEGLGPRGGADILATRVSAELLSGEAEGTYWAQIEQHRKNKRMIKEEKGKLKRERKVEPRFQPVRKKKAARKRRKNGPPANTTNM